MPFWITGSLFFEALNHRMGGLMTLDNVSRLWPCLIRKKKLYFPKWNNLYSIFLCRSYTFICGALLWRKINFSELAKQKNKTLFWEKSNPHRIPGYEKLSTISDKLKLLMLPEIRSPTVECLFPYRWCRQVISLHGMAPRPEIMVSESSLVDSYYRVVNSH